MHNAMLDVALIVGTLTILYMLCTLMDKKRRGAEKVSRKELERHQAVRRVLIKEGEYR